MAHGVAHRFSPAAVLRGWVNTISARRAMTPQQRADLYVSRMPIAVITASLGGHPPDRSGDHR